MDTINLDECSPMILPYTFEDFRIIKKLGKGGYGYVWKVKHIDNDKHICAIKSIQKRKVLSQNMKHQLVNEIKYHYALNHPNIISMYGYFTSETNVYIVLESFEGMDMYDFLYKNNKMSEDKACKYIIQIVTAVKYCHDNGIIHGDIKLENCLIDSNEKIKLCDFGWCTRINEITNTVRGTIDYMAPEIINMTVYDHRVDIWAIGILTYELLYDKTPFHDKSYPNTYENICNNEIKYNDSTSKTCQDFINRHLEKDYRKRITTEEALNHPWLNPEI